MSNKSFVDKYFSHAVLLTSNEPAKVSHFLETRTRQGDITDALRFRIYDPLWMLSRQWQMGEFRGNDAGTAMTVSCNVRQSKFSSFTTKDKDEPLEPIVESIDREVTPLVRVESAMYFLDILSDKVPDEKEYDKIVKWVRGNSHFTLDWDKLKDFTDGSIQVNEVKEFTASCNTRLMKFIKSFKGKVFDGFALFCYLSTVADNPVPQSVSDQYTTWFERRYYSLRHSNNWDTQSMKYGFEAHTNARSFLVEDYGGGRVSWYTFDAEGTSDCNDNHGHVTRLYPLPSLATYASAPNKRLWEFEDRKVFMGNATGMQAKGNVAFMEFATMYGNDWMLCPIETQVGRYIEVSDITVSDSFGIVRKISRRAGEDDRGAATFGQKWQMFTNAPEERSSPSSKPANGFLFPPALPRTLEGQPIEEINFLRDEMANMVWGVEERIDDGCGSSLDATRLAADVGQFVDDAYEAEVEKARFSVDVMPDGHALMTSDKKADYKYTLMTSVPFNWIPFVPQHIRDSAQKDEYSDFLGGREIALRRGKMPCYFNGEYRPVRPLSSVLKPTFMVRKSDGKKGEKPLFIDEEQVQGVGTKIVKNCQRARWIGGETYTWMGYSKEIKNTQGTSGLEYDDLKDNI